MPGHPELPISIPADVRQTDVPWDDKEVYGTHRGPKPQPPARGTVRDAWMQMIEESS